MEFSEEIIEIFYDRSKYFLLDFISGSIAGVAVTLSGHPFDTIKVRMQRDFSRQRKRFLECVKECYLKEGFNGYYKGMSFPISTVPIVNAVVFAVHEAAKRIFGIEHESDMTLAEGIICGGLAGLANCIIVTPVELVKCRLQIQLENKGKAYYKGVQDCVAKTYREFGIKGLYKGNSAAILREIPAYAGQFGGYFYCKKFLSKYKNKKIDELNNIELMICGSFGGYICWQFSYPQDVIKTLLQTSNLDKLNSFKARYLDGGFISCGNYIYNSQGMAGFWRGFLPCTLRALISNAVLFVTYENSKGFLYKIKEK